MKYYFLVLSMMFCCYGFSRIGSDRIETTYQIPLLFIFIVHTIVLQRMPSLSDVAVVPYYRIVTRHFFFFVTSRNLGGGGLAFDGPPRSL